MADKPFKPTWLDDVIRDAHKRMEAWPPNARVAMREAAAPSVSSQNPSDNPRTAGKAGEHD